MTEETNKNESEQIEIRSEEVQEILSHIPHWLIRWGITLIFIVIAVLILASWFIKYNDVVPARVVLTTEVPPAHVVARSSGKINLKVLDQVHVAENDVLGIIENPASYPDIIITDQLVNKYKDSIYGEITNFTRITFDESLNLGSVQDSYLAFISSIEKIKRFDEIATYENQKKTMTERIQSYEDENRGLKNQQRILEQQVGISRSIYEDDLQLYNKNAGTKTEMMRSKTNYLQSERNLGDLKISINRNKGRIAELQGEIEQLELKQREELDQLKNGLQQTFEQLEGSIIQWKQTYLLRTPIAGKVSFSKIWSDYQYVQTNEVVMSVIPASEAIIGNVTMQMVGSGKVEVGQRVNMKLDNYPSNEYGMVTGKVKAISLVPRDNSYSIRISLPNGLLSTYNKELVFKQEMQGTADIITEEKRLIERVFNQLRNILDKAS